MEFWVWSEAAMVYVCSVHFTLHELGGNRVCVQGAEDYINPAMPTCSTMGRKGTIVPHLLSKGKESLLFHL